MKRFPLLALMMGILFLFLIQSAGTLIESIYILDLLNTSLDEKVLGVVFFFIPVLALPFFSRRSHLTGWSLLFLAALSRGLTPYLTTSNRLISAGFTVASTISLFLLLLNAKPKGETRAYAHLQTMAGFALAVGLSTLLRTVYDGVDYSLVPAGGWVGWLLSAILAGLLTQVEYGFRHESQQKRRSVTAPLVGIFLLITLVYFVFSAPAVIVRWTESNYTLVVGAVSLLSLGWCGLVLFRPQFIDHISPNLLLVWNFLFTLSLTGTLLAHRVSFPASLGSPAVVVSAPSWWQQVPLGFTLLLFPVIFLDFRVFINQVKHASPSPRSLAPGILLGGLLLILFVFMHIFTNVWGYVKPVSLWFRNLFWLPHFLLTAGASLILWRVQKRRKMTPIGNLDLFHPGWAAVLGGLFLLTVVASFPGAHLQEVDSGKTSLIAMTFNTQQFNDDPGEKSYDRQIDLILRASPDILVLQESDSNRISINNNDYVRYFAEKLGYYAYYGPTPVTGTYGTAILSKYPLENTRSVFIFSDKDETGVAEAEVVIAGRRFTIYNVHPDSSDPAMVEFAQKVLARASDKENVIVLGDFNLREDEQAYQLFDRTLTNAWVSVYPTKISKDGVDMSGRNRIDHIFISRHLKARNPVYILPPASATDHPVHWAEIGW